MDFIEERRAQTYALMECSRLIALEHTVLQKRFTQVGLTITPGQSRALMILFEERDGMSASALSRRMGLSEVTVSRFVKGLVRRGWVQRARDPHDGRVWIVRPTEKAHATLPLFIQISNQLLDEIFRGFDASEVAQLNVFIERMRANAEPSDAS